MTPTSAPGAQNGSNRLRRHYFITAKGLRALAASDLRRGRLLEAAKSLWAILRRQYR